MNGKLVAYFSGPISCDSLITPQAPNPPSKKAFLNNLNLKARCSAFPCRLE